VEGNANKGASEKRKKAFGTKDGFAKEMGGEKPIVKVERIGAYSLREESSVG